MSPEVWRQATACCPFMATEVGMATLEVAVPAPLAPAAFLPFDVVRPNSVGPERRASVR